MNNQNGKVTVLRSYKVNYLSGLPNLMESLKEVQMQVQIDGFYFWGKGFPPLFIPYGRVENLQLKTGYGTFINAGLYDGSREKLFEIIFYDSASQCQTIRFEMSQHTGFPRANYRACQELVSVLRSNGIFQKFRSNPQNNPAISAVMAQITQLYELHKSGALTDEEFQSKKDELLKKI